MAIKQTTIQGTVLLPSGDPSPGGNIQLKLSTEMGVTPDDATSSSYVVGSSVEVVISSLGIVNFTLVPNDAITPAGTVWVAEYYFPGGKQITECWSILDGPDIEIGDIVRTKGAQISGGGAFLIVSSFSLLPAPSSSVKGVCGYVEGVANQMDIKYMCMKGWDDVYRWVRVTEGGGP